MGRLEVEHVIPLTRGGTDDDSVDLIVRSSGSGLGCIHQGTGTPSTTIRRTLDVKPVPAPPSAL